MIKWSIKLHSNNVRAPYVIIDSSIQYAQRVLMGMIHSNIIQLPKILQITDGIEYTAQNIYDVYNNIREHVDYEIDSITDNRMNYVVKYDQDLYLIEFGLQNNGLFLFSQVYRAFVEDKDAIIWDAGDHLYLYSPKLENMSALRDMRNEAQVYG